MKTEQYVFKCPKCNSDNVEVCSEIWHNINEPYSVTLEAIDNSAISLFAYERILCLDCKYEGIVNDLYFEEKEN